AATVIDGGTRPKELSETSPTTSPPEGAGPESVTVPCDVEPAGTAAGLNDREKRHTAAGSAGAVECQLENRAVARCSALIRHAIEIARAVSRQISFRVPAVRSAEGHERAQLTR